MAGVSAPRDRVAFVTEFSRVLAASADLDTYGELAQVVREWRATAEIHAGPVLARRLRKAVATPAGALMSPPLG
jgi:Family of unknown function (DUF6247)